MDPSTAYPLGSFATASKMFRVKIPKAITVHGA